MIASGQRVVLRDGLSSDVDDYLRWMRRGEWLRFDAPWENEPAMTDDEIRTHFTKRFLNDPSTPRWIALIVTKEERALGWVNRYGDKRFPDAWLVGIDICEDDSLNKGLGTEALGLWVDYLFSNSNVHRIGFDTYSFNRRMIRVGEKLGFVHEGTDREVIYWKGSWLDRLHFGMLRNEWERRSTRSIPLFD
jgi:RimJ/RimL family protein N-acetyltransferase